MTFALISVIWLAVCWQLKTEHEGLYRDLARDTANYTLVFEQNVARTASELDRIIKFVRAGAEQMKSRQDWQLRVKESFAVHEEAVQVSVIDADGIMITSTAMPHSNTRIDLSDREHFQFHRYSDRDQLFIGKPLIGRASGKWSVQFARRFETQTGDFGGVIVASLNPSLLTRTYNQLKLGKGGGLALIGQDGIVRAGTGVFENSLGRSLESNGSIKSTAYLHEGTIVQLKEIDGEMSAVVHRAVSGYPLELVAIQDNGHELAAWKTKRARILYATVFLSLLIIAIATGVSGSLKSREAQIGHLARHDTLTALANRAQFQESLEIAFSEPSGQSMFALHLIDLDGFKGVNDTYGHPTGDKLLKAVAQRLRSILRNTDLVARLGGDEFAVLQSGARTDTEARAVAERICRSIGEHFEVDGVSLIIGASVGIAIGRKDANNSPDLLKAADLALYTAKASGRRTFRFYDEAMNTMALARRDLESGLRAALESDQLVLHYQPIASLATREVRGFEALLRWNRPGTGMVAPNDFIPIAEETGLIIPIGAWVLRAACMEMAARSDHLRIAVNCSPLQFKSKSFVDTVKAALEESGLPPDRLEIEIEITESTLMQKDTATVEKLDQIRKLGIHISMDDFGTGYSSLSYLQTYPINCIKIDRSFVKTLGEDRSAAPIIRAITALASSLGMTTIAEGVETEAQLLELLDLGCTEAQGYYFSRPAPASVALPALRAAHSSIAA